MAPIPPTAPETAPATPPSPVDVAKIELRNATTDTAANLQRLKDQLKAEGITNENDPNVKAEIEELTRVFNEKKINIKFITKAELQQLASAIKDTAPGGQTEKLEGTLETKADGELVFNETIPSGGETRPETPLSPVDLGGVTGLIPPEYQKEVKNYGANNEGFGAMVRKSITNWVVEIINGIKGFFATWGIEDEGEKKDILAQINGFEDAEEERRVTASVKALKSSPVTKGPPLSDILKINHISNEDLTKILKENPGLDFSSAKNIDAAFTGKYEHSGNREPMKRYDRIFLTLRDKHADIVANPGQGYQATEMFTKILNGSKDASYDPEIADAIPAAAPVLAPVVGVVTPTESGTTSPEVQRELMTQATDLNEALIKANAMPTGTAEETKTKEEAVKKAQEGIKKFQEERKNTILKEYTSIKDRIKKGEIERKTLETRNSPEEAEKKKLTEINTDLIRLKRIESEMKSKIDEVMTQNGEAWEIKPGATTISMTAVEIAISTIENNTATLETKILSKEEKEAQEKEKKAQLEEYQKILDGNRITSNEKMQTIKEYLEKYPDPKLQEKFEVMKSKIALVKMTVKKKNEMKEADRFINWDNVDEDSRGGWVEIDDSYSGGSALEDISWLELDADGFAEVDWQLVQGDNYHVKKVGGLFNARKILNDNKDIIKNSDDSENLKI